MMIDLMHSLCFFGGMIFANNTESMIAAGASGMTVSFTSSVGGSTDPPMDVFVLVVVKV